jgi:hypothetical protein
MTKKLLILLAGIFVGVLFSDLTAASLQAASGSDACSTGRVPVVAGRRKSLRRNHGLVYYFANASFKDLPVQITINSPTFGKTKSYDLILSAARPGPVKEIGNMQGWEGSSGDEIEIKSGKLDPLKLTIP